MQSGDSACGTENTSENWTLHSRLCGSLPGRPFVRFSFPSSGEGPLPVGSQVCYESIWDEKRGSRKAQKVARVKDEDEMEVIQPHTLRQVICEDGEEWELVT